MLNEALPSEIRQEISSYLGSEARRYVISSLDGDVETGCECWDLPPVKEEDTPIHMRYQDILQRVTTLMQEDKTDPRIEALKREAAELLKGLPVSKRAGASVVSMDALLSLDERKGIRAEWWELHGRLVGRTVCVFQGYRTVEAATARQGDMLIAMPEADPYEFLRIHQTRGNNHAVDTDEIIEALRKLDAEVGIAIVSASAEHVELLFRRPVQAAHRARVRQRLRRLCPSAELSAEGLRLGRIVLWWD